MRKLSWTQWLWIAGGALGLGALGWGVLRRVRGDAVVLYSTNVPVAGELGTFRGVAQNAGRHHRVEPVGVGSGQAILDEIRRHGRIGALLMVGHGTSQQWLRPGVTGVRVGSSSPPTWISARDLARELAPRLVSEFWVGFLACRSGANPNEPDWTTATYRGGGERSLAAILRDELVDAGAPTGEIGAHTTTGATEANPVGRVFVVDRAHRGRPGDALQDIAWGAGSSSRSTEASAWRRLIRGKPAARWAFIGETPIVPRPS